MLNRLLLVTITCVVFTCQGLQAQEAPLYSQYFTNPFLYNPAFAGTDGHAVAFLTHRRQWVGIEGAPTLYGVSVHTPFSKTMAGGLQLRTESRGVLRSSVAMATVGYTAHFGEKHFLRMGLASGISHHTADFSEATELQQPYLANWANQAMRFEAAFGINYHLRHFNLGLSLPQLTAQKVISADAQELFEFSPLEQWVGTASYYAIITPEKVELEPLFIAQKVGEDKIRYEAGAVLYLNRTLWGGGTYRYQYGGTALLGLNLTPGISFGYAYEFANALVGSMLKSTHELQIKIRLGADKNYSQEVQHKPRFEM
ncbi:PorP/SprF family type IX secretion system membrane protein [Cesiribacter andamanensis]|uniref:Bacteroidetes-specific putative membrane protein n=1 Tax=Cesiribacter andamanensis AMV16 TaxID=1279009 RepID=M7NWM7_9BACT|nr:type IX secretion system membrane protein PorP/SprF [Cesiribacter andamanensis]EMR02844.1 Bacteroidetes-specific putative membrane protein [Cesiribacter andamanensis AMV16]